MLISADLTIRPLAGAGELDLFGGLAYSLDHELADDLASGRRRPEWMWVALSGDRLLARLAWWTTPGGSAPLALDFFDLDDTLDDPERTDVGLRLLTEAMAAVLPEGTTPPEYSRFVPADWRADERVRRAVEGRMGVLEKTGARLFVERLRLEWLPGTPIPERTGRMAFRPAGEDLVDLMTVALEGTLDAHSVAEMKTMTARESALLMYEEEFLTFNSPREWWTVAEVDGEAVGFVVPARNNYNPIIAYVGVLPAHRGNGYIDEILAEGTRILAGEGVPRIRAATDVANVPMAAAFARAGYSNFERALNLTWS